MKRIGLVTVVVGLIACVAWAADVPSRNAVGVTKVEVPANKFLLAALPFNDFGGSIQDVFDGQLTGADNPDESDRIYLQSGVTYDIYWKVEGTGTGWDGKWLSEADGSHATNVMLYPGEGFWIENKHGSAQPVAFMGEVPNEGSATNWISASGFTMLGYPYSAGDYLGSNTTFATSGGYGADNPDEADRLYFYIPATGGYRIYWLVGGTGTEWDGKWLSEADGTLADETFDLGEGAWYQRRAAAGAGFNWVESRPYPAVNQP